MPKNSRMAVLVNRNSSINPNTVKIRTAPEGMLAENERRAARRATLLRVGVGEQRPFLGDAVDVGRLVTHDAEAVGADVVPADVVAPDDQDVGLRVRRLRRHDGA